MIDIKKVSVMNLDNAIRGMRNAHESWDKSDSSYCTCISPNCDECRIFNKEECVFFGSTPYMIGEKDLGLARSLVKAGTDHSKFMRQILVSMDITAPRLWWCEADTYKVATVANSTSTMHTLTKAPITKELFSFNEDTTATNEIVQWCEYYRLMYKKTGDKKYWRTLIEILPQSFNQSRTWTANYQVLRNIYKARKGHKLEEWNKFVEVIETLPYSELIIM